MLFAYSQQLVQTAQGCAWKHQPSPARCKVASEARPPATLVHSGARLLTALTANNWNRKNIAVSCESSAVRLCRSPLRMSEVSRKGSTAKKMSSTSDGRKPWMTEDSSGSSSSVCKNGICTNGSNRIGYYERRFTYREELHMNPVTILRIV